MRVLVTALAGAGHLFPLVTTAWALRAAGHEVLFATGGDMGAVATTGLHSYDVAPGLDMRSVVGANGPNAFRSSTTGQAFPTTPEAVREHPAFRMFNGLAEAMVDGLVGLAKEWQPDLVVYESMHVIALLAAEAAGAKAVSHAIGVAQNQRMLDLFGSMQVDIFQRYGLDAIPKPDAHIDVAPPSFKQPEGWSMRYVPYNGGGQLPGWLTARPERPRIAVTLGTVAPMMTGLGPVERIAAAAEKIDAEFVLALGNADASGLDLPDNVRSVGYVPLGPLLATSTAVIHHGGAGTTLTALDAGVPQIVVPQGADGPINAAAVAAAGCGFNVATEELDGTVIERLLSEESLRVEAARVRAEMHAMPSPASVAERLTKNFGGQIS
ncbi:nucleotide disphospho-sugar-binding domain-containing protein [Kutzneria chonburiensis]|uniref:Nucleotide disphospho-sugar-binding domain-containing protein n=1 Tax=Kutzneria chonburiensis TaxID=1483604 RepID=A0ABV6MV08_9PSEU|nr:nucleotide disphospho-sugar-binding domain-containing protein [Kutzneria chonburiensis]